MDVRSVTLLSSADSTINASSREVPTVCTLRDAYLRYEEFRVAPEIDVQGGKRSERFEQESAFFTVSEWLETLLVPAYSLHMPRVNFADDPCTSYAYPEDQQIFPQQRELFTSHACSDHSKEQRQVDHPAWVRTARARATTSAAERHNVSG